MTSRKTSTPPDGKIDATSKAELRAEIARLRRLNHTLTLNLARTLENERRQLARELHDEIGQALTAIKADTVLICSQCKNKCSLNQISVQSILDTVSGIYEVVYSMMRRLRPGVLDEMGLGPALETLVAEWRKRHPYIRCELDVAQDLSSNDDLVNITVYRTVQEALTNATRHSAATCVKVSATRESEAHAVNVCVKVEDNGRGMDNKKLLSSTGQFGLRGLTERIEALGGRLDIDSAPGQGTKVSARVPVARPAETNE